MSIKNTLRGANYLLFSDTLALWGFLANLGIITLTYITLQLFSSYILSFESISFLGRLNIFSITYWILMGITYKAAIGENNKFNAGFILSAMLITLAILGTYLREIF